MSATARRTVSLPKEQAAFIDAKVAAGDYASASEVLRAGLSALRERDNVIDHWLREEVAPAYDAVLADPARARTADQVWSAVEARHAERAAADR